MIKTNSDKKAEIEKEKSIKLRRAAYADVYTGSDALFIEYQALIAKDSDRAEEAKSAWLARREEIKKEFPI